MTIITKLRHTLNSTHLEICQNPEYQKLMPVKVIDEAKYKSILTSNLHIHNSLESKIKNTLLQSSPSSLHDFFHSRMEWLGRDFESMGMSMYGASSNDFFSPGKYETISAMLGAWYVVEESMLGNRMIYNWLRSSPHLSHIPEFHFHKNYDTKIGKRWRAFQTLILEHIKNEKQCLAEAKITFQFYSHILHEKSLSMKGLIRA